MRRLEPNLNGIDTSHAGLTGAIEWNHIKVQPDTRPTPPENAPSRYYAARGTDAAPIAVGDQHEKFLFYRGVGRFPVPLVRALSRGGSGREPNARRGSQCHPVRESRRPAGLSTGWRGRRLDQARAAVAGGSLAQLRYDLETALVGQGFFPKEAQAMVETWRDSWFEEGSRLIYIFRRVRWTPFFRSRSSHAVAERVFVGRIELITPETKRSVKEALAAGDSATVDRYRRFLEPIVARMGAGNADKASRAELLQCR